MSKNEINLLAIDPNTGTYYDVLFEFASVFTHNN